jgi:transposase InsO family protein
MTTSTRLSMTVPGSLQPDPARRAGHHRGSLPGRGGQLLRRPWRADRAGADRERQGLCRVGGLCRDSGWAGIRLKRTRRYRPQTNGKVERFNKTLLDEWAYARLYRSNHERCRAFARWLRTYNHRRPHTSLDGLTPMAVLVNNLGGKHT